MRHWSDVLAGLVAGGFIACAYLLAGPLTLIPGLLVWGVGLARHRSLPALAASCLGFGTAWVLLIGQVLWRCAGDPTCVTTSGMSVWFVPGVVLFALGIVLGLVARSRLSPGRRSRSSPKTRVHLPPGAPVSPESGIGHT